MQNKKQELKNRLETLFNKSVNAELQGDLEASVKYLEAYKKLKTKLMALNEFKTEINTGSL